MTERSDEARAHVGEVACEIAAKTWPGTKWEIAPEEAVPLSAAELAYLSRAIFRQRIDKPDDEAALASTLDAKISVARMRAESR